MYRNFSGQLLSPYHFTGDFHPLMEQLYDTKTILHLNVTIKLLYFYETH